ncbi:hypothetical protein Btru_042378 [Bulinus truncatus]|nr:hypothetical protein Btru_042378 [Bulinus truncatus]
MHDTVAKTYTHNNDAITPLQQQRVLANSAGSLSSTAINTMALNLDISALESTAIISVERGSISVQKVMSTLLRIVVIFFSFCFYLIIV